MPAAGAGLPTHIWNNNLKSIALLAVYWFLIAVLVWGVVFVLGYLETQQAEHAVNLASNILYKLWPAVFGAVAIWFVIAWFIHGKMVRKLAKSHPVTRKDEPEIYNLLENLCIAQGVTMPRLEIIETHARNAFASGIDQKSYTITVTRGLLNSLTKDEVEAVLAHELAHILNRDVRLLIVTIIFTGLFGFLAQLAWNNLRYSLFFGGRRRGKSDGRAMLFIIVVMVALWIGYLVSLMLRFALSRKREYMADGGAVAMTKNPAAMMSALQRIAGRARGPGMSEDIAAMCIENSQKFFGMFATHPPIDSRIEAISQTTGTSVPDNAYTGPAPKEERLEYTEQPQNPWLTKKRPRRGT